MTDPRIIGTVTVGGIPFEVSFVSGTRGSISLPQDQPVRDPNGTQGEQSAGRLVFDFGQFELRADIIPSGATRPNYKPIVTVQSLSISEDGVLSGQMTATDIDGTINAASWQFISVPSGFAGNADGSFSYTPPASFQSLNVNETSTVSFTCRVADNQGLLSDIHSQDITITGASDAPVIAAVGTITTDANSTVTFDAFASDVEGDIDSTTWRVGTAPIKGIVTIGTGGVGNTFDPNAEFGALGVNDHEDVTFTLLVDDLEGSTASPVTVTVRVTGTASAPTATNGAVSMTEDTTVTQTVNLAALVIPGTAAIASYELLNTPANLTVTNFNAAAGTFDVKPVTSAFQSLTGSQSSVLNIAWRALDANGANSNAANVVVTVTGINDAPVIPDPSINILAGDVGFVDPSITDVDTPGHYASGPAFEWLGAAFRTDTGSTVDVGSITFLNDTHQTVGGVPPGRIQADMTGALSTLAAGQVVTVQRNWRRRDSEGDWSVARKVRVFVTGIDQPVEAIPTMTPITLSTDAGVPVTVDLINSTNDADGDYSTWTIVSQALDASGNVLGSVTLESDGTYPTGRLRYAPGNAFDSLLLGQTAQVIAQVSHFDTLGNLSNTVTVTITINGLAQAPVAQNYSFSVNADATFSGQVPAATDANGNLNANGYAQFGTSSPQTDGLLSISASGAVTFDPNGIFDSLLVGQTATKVFQYTASDTTAPNALVSSPATITVTINGVVSAPMTPEPMYPAASMAAMTTKYPWEASGMARHMALPSAFPADKTAVQSGAWSDPATWGGAVPLAGHNVKIPWGITVTFNEAWTALFAGSKAYGFIEVHGTLIFAPFMNTRLRCDTLWGSYSAELIIKPSAGVIAEMSFPANGNIDTTKDPALLTRGLVWNGKTQVMDAGAGTASEKDPYAYVDYWGASGRKPKAGDTQLILTQAPVGWAVGDKINLPQTDNGERKLVELTFEDEERTITAISGNVITLDSPLTYDHDYFPEKPDGSSFVTPSFDVGDGQPTGGAKPELVVANLSRKIRFVSEGGNSIPVYQRPHIMLMHRTNANDIQWCGTEIVDFGRTSKIVPAFTPGQMAGNPIVFDSNMKSRYPAHLHWVGIDPVDEIYRGEVTFKRNAVYRSPGWAIAHHRSSAVIEDCVTWDAFGHIVQESGDEIGRWLGNVTIRGRVRRRDNNGTTGLVIETKQAEFVVPHDQGASGQGFFFQGRMIEFWESARGWNRAYGMYEPVTWIHRSRPVSPTLDFGQHDVEPLNWIHGAAVGWKRNMAADEPSITKVGKFQFSGCRRGMRVVKASPDQRHDLRSHFRDFIVTGCLKGLEWEYTGHYSAHGFLIVRSKRLASNQQGPGVELFNNTVDIVLADGIIGGHPQGTGGFQQGVSTTHIKVKATLQSQSPVAGAWGYVFDNIKFGAQAGLADNTADMPTYLETRTGQDNITGVEDRAFNMTFLNPASNVVETFGSPPNPLTTMSASHSFVLANSTDTVPDTRPPTVAAQWNFSPGSYGYYGTVTDGYGDKESPHYYGPVQPFVNQNDSVDWNARDRNNLAGLLRVNGYWQEPGGAYFVEDEVWSMGRVMNTPFKQTKRLYIASNTPGILNNPVNANLGNQTFTFNGVKA